LIVDNGVELLELLHSKLVTSFLVTRN